MLGLNQYVIAISPFVTKIGYITDMYNTKYGWIYKLDSYNGGFLKDEISLYEKL